MYPDIKKSLLLVIPLVFVLLCNNTFAAPKYLFKVASIAPEGSIWVKRFHDFSAEIAAKSNNEIGFKVYPGGIMGDDRAVYRKMKINQLQGGGFTMTGIGSVVPDFRVMSVPFLFHSYEEVDHVIRGLWPTFKKDFSAKDLELLAMTEVGFVYSMSTVPVSTIDALKMRKIWAPENDPVSKVYLKTLGITPLPLAIPDVLPSLQTGMVETVFNSLYGSIVLQWFTKTKYVSDIPFGYAYGCFLLNKKKFSRLPEQYQALLRQTAKKHFSLLIIDTRKSNHDSRQVLLDNGVAMIAPAPSDVAELQRMREQTVEKVQGKAFSPGIYQALSELLQEFRQKDAPK